ncbi:MAG TPA: GDSL-type esterase/lipase family protein [Roseimicrobium sp.]|nr:GDSL-type esterase/lipase family protein [Roseimicrobium sp.]
MSKHRLSLLLVALTAFAPAFLTAQTAPKSAAAAPDAAEIPAIGRLPDTDDGLPGAGPIRRYDWFRKLWAQRRVMWSKSVQQDQGAVVFLGDSITQGWGKMLEESFPGLKAANRGISGDTTRGVMIRLKEDVLDLNPRAIVLLIGTNDLEEGAEPEVIAGNVKLLLEAFKKHNPKMPVLFCQVFPSSETKKRPADKIKKLNELCAAAIKGNTQVVGIDTWPLFANDQGNAKVEEFPDLLHPNKLGYQKWVKALVPIFNTLDILPAPADTFTPEAEFISLFNGKDLTGWGYKTNNFDGKSASVDGRYIAKDGKLIVLTPSEGRKIQQIWTTKEFPKDFVLKLQFRASANADSGVFIRKPQLQCRDYIIAGPYKNLMNYKPQEWNDLEVTVKDGVANCTCNGEILEAALKVPPTGPIGLEGDRGQLEYRHIQLKELP